MTLQSVRDFDIKGGGHGHHGLLAQLLDVDLTTDETIVNADGNVPLFRITFNKKDGNSAIRISFKCSASNDTNATQIRFRVVIDGTVHRACGCRGQGGIAQAAAIQHVERGLAAGNHIIEIQWSTTGGTGRIRPVSNADDESATMIVEEVLTP